MALHHSFLLSTSPSAISKILTVSAAVALTNSVLHCSANLHKELVKTRPTRKQQPPYCLLMPFLKEIQEKNQDSTYHPYLLYFLVTKVQILDFTLKFSVQKDAENQP